MASTLFEDFTAFIYSRMARLPAAFVNYVADTEGDGKQAEPAVEDSAEQKDCHTSRRCHAQATTSTLLAALPTLPASLRPARCWRGQRDSKDLLKDPRMLHRASRQGRRCSRRTTTGCGHCPIPGHRRRPRVLQHRLSRLPGVLYGAGRLELRQLCRSVPAVLIGKKMTFGTPTHAPGACQDESSSLWPPVTCALGGGR
ncbi:hypothetical protein HPB50_012452 [Hyalomma asiaticum]|uniref:Uncharacterized protein n=1 Tax=Hyalomma asiaticum TaxID=266040 RepID=A0ACB7TJP8_HYAAI|nr:hypothetical protein HPB50_012452 [Hyalomma asiaticum]